METAVTIDQVDQAAGTLSRAASLAAMSLADHQACAQAAQMIVRYIQQVRADHAAKVPQTPQREVVAKE